MVVGRSGACERSEDDAMGKGQSTDLEGGEESRRISGRRHLSSGSRVFHETVSEAELLEPDISNSSFLYSPSSKEIRISNTTDE